ncbi:sulfite exporter TauE/SafE family protein [Yoonia vestfoldensis]|uniref:sulfite exporter TauE/SafE family protein n=1 Tax=Yoonia vestfoldensis TaxID=245188 RepID=UPI000376BB32|nr:sulfite exporter TauE/SafE family protein [Yoonia vestfoldensis]
MTLDWAELIPLILGIMATGAVAGVLSGLLGVGGGIVIVPVLFWVFGWLGLPAGLGMQVAVATSLVAVAVTASSSARAHHARGAVDTDILRLWAPFMGLGALAGGALAGIVSGRALLALFGVIALLVAWNMARPKTRILAAGLPATHGVQPAMAGFVGLVSAMMGIGSGTLGVPLLTAFSVPVHRAVGTAAALGLVIGVPASLAMIVAGWGVQGRPPFSLGYVNIAAVALILPLSVACAPVGARLAHALEPVWIKRAFAVFLLVTSIKMLMSAFG